ncbi:TPA: phage tail protein [Klebsiella oxytoca]|nr:phage tail protein [Klebsiella oxytoca]HEC2124460.1 phage tail protein [Klebsiella oxytoca]HEJ8141424.1 phage tail protein [Klebsiella oxytoca]
MTVKYFAILTSQGAARLANAAALGVKLNITQMAIGDGGGELYTPEDSQTKLKNQLRIAPLNMLSIDPKNASQIIAEQIIPENEGGYWIREIGLYDDDGILIAIANCPETYKPKLQEGSGRTQTIRMILIVSSTASITLKIDPSVVLATRQYVDETLIEIKSYADELISKHVAEHNPHSQYPVIENALKEMADAGLVDEVLENLRLSDVVTLREELASDSGSILVNTETGRDIGTSVRAASGASHALFPNLMAKLNAYKHGASDSQSMYRLYGFGSSVGDGATIGGKESPETPVAKFFEFMNDAINFGGIYPVSFLNKSVSGSAINNFNEEQWPAVISEGVYPDIALFVYGMNDFPTAQYNAGRTFSEVNGFVNSMRNAIRSVRAAGGDVVLTTTPHPNLSIYSWSMPDGIAQVWPSYVPAPVSDNDIIPSAAHSNVTFEWNGVNIQAGVRFLRGNDAIRRLAVEMGCVLIDVEKYWFDAVAKYGESALFDAGQTVHPNLLGHQQSYQLAFKEFFANVAHNGWTAPDSSHNDVFDVGGVSQYPNPKEGDIDLQAGGYRKYAHVLRDKFSRILERTDQSGNKVKTSYTSQYPTSSVPGYKQDWSEYHTRTKGLFSAGESFAIAITNRETKKLLIDCWSSEQNGWAQCYELFVSNREGVIEYTVIGEHDNTPGKQRLFALSSGEGALMVNVKLSNSSLKYRICGFGL